MPVEGTDGFGHCRPPAGGPRSALRGNAGYGLVSARMHEAERQHAGTTPTTDETIVADALRHAPGARAGHGDGGGGAFRGPYSDGPPESALRVDTPSIESFGFAELRRMVVIYVVLTYSIAAAVVAAVARRVARRSTPSLSGAAADGMVDGFERLGPTFVKLGQLVASSPGLFPATVSNACQRCLDEVPPFDGETARRMIRMDLGRDPEEIFRHFDATPLSAASIGQVHACVLPDGREAVIKLQRPNIWGRMTTDLRIMHRLAHTLQKRSKSAERMNAVGIIEDLHEVTFAELNPSLEAWRQHRFRENLWAFGDNKMITAPEVYWEYCGPHMICMERMSGVPVDEFDVLAERGIDGELVIRRGAKAWLEAVVAHGPFHGDMHAGNIWVLDDGRSAYLDFGIMGELPGEWHGVFRDLLLTVAVDRDWTRVVRAYRSVGILPEGLGTEEDLAMALGAMMEPLLDLTVSERSLGESLKASVEMSEQMGATSSPKELVLVFKQLIYIERFINGLAPDYNLLNDPYVIKNIFPEHAAQRAEELGVSFPD